MLYKPINIICIDVKTAETTICSRSTDFIYYILIKKRGIFLELYRIILYIPSLYYNEKNAEKKKPLSYFSGLIL